MNARADLFDDFARSDKRTAADLAMRDSVTSKNLPIQRGVPPYEDYLAESEDGPTCVQFGPPGFLPSIPQHFFGSGSDPFQGLIVFEGDPLNPSLLGDASTIIRRPGPPFLPADPPFGPPVTVPIEIVALNLVSIQPITVTYNGGQNPQQWNVRINLSPTPVPPPNPSQLTAFKQHPNGGVFNSVLFVRPLFVFTQVPPGMGMQQLDTGALGFPPIRLESQNDAWVHFVNPDLGVITQPGNHWVPGIAQPNPTDITSQEEQAFDERSQDNGITVKHWVCPAYVVTCPLAPGNWCQGLQNTECLNGAAGEVCWPTHGSITATGTPAITTCDCITEGCGKIAVQIFADGTFAYRCLDQCPDPTQPCVIYKNGNATTNSAIHSSQVAPGDQITCDCKPPPPSVCPLEAGSKICESVQAVDCQATVAGETCRPDVVLIGTSGEVLGKRCDCFPDQATCGPVLVINLPPPSGTQISCDVNCPNPAVEECHIYRNGFSTGQISAPASSFVPGDELSCNCDPIQEPVCPLEPGLSWCAGLQNINCREGQAGEQCKPTLVTIGFMGEIDICACDCLTTECQEVSITPVGAGHVLSCPNTCPFPGQQCVIHINNAPTTMTSVPSSQVLGQYVSCDCAGGPNMCPLAPGNWCQGLQNTNCVGGAAGEECWPSHTSISASGTPAITACDCAGPGCGKMAVQTFPDGTFAYRCLDTCPDPTQPCVIYKNNVATTSGAIHSSQIAAGDDIRCDCKPPPPSVCPLQTGTKICESVQAVDCQSTAAGETCKPDRIKIGPNGQLLGDRCTCFFDDATCGPILIINLPPSQGGTQISCDVNCPTAVEQCHIYLNGASTGLISAPASSFDPGDELSCACDPIQQPLCPLPPTAWCDELQDIMCREGQPGEQCKPTQVVVGFTGDLDMCACDCLGSACQEVTITPDPLGYMLSCDNACINLGQQCVIHINNAPTNMTSVHSSQVLGQYVSCDCAQAQLGACCLGDGTCINTTQANCPVPILAVPCSGSIEACCVQLACSMMDRECCLAQQGTPMGPGSNCSGVVTGCCRPGEFGTTQICENVDPQCCTNFGGTPQFGQQCTGSTEACCLPNGTCLDIDPICCDEQGGTPQGNGSVCLGDLNGNGVDDACEDPGCEPLPDHSGCTQSECPCFGECINGGYCDDPNCCLDPTDYPNNCLCYAPNNQVSIKLCGDCFGQCLGGSYCDDPSDPPSCWTGPGGPVCWVQNHPISIYLCGGCFGTCVNGSYCDHPDPDCCIAGPGNCVCYAASHPISKKMCPEGEVDHCQPRCVNYNPLTGQTLVTVCDCAGVNECHVSLGGPAPALPDCVDACPPGQNCVRTETTNVNGTIDICCDCEGPPPNEEACCLQNAVGFVCFMTLPANCVAQGGNPQGPGSVCLGIAACCLPGGACANVDRVCCNDLGGTAQAAGTMCLGDSNGDGRDDACGCLKCQLHGDIVDVNSVPPGDCNVDVSDILCVLDEFVDIAICEGNGDLVAADFGCVPDGKIDVSDILSVLSAFSGTFDCPHPCPPGACCAEFGPPIGWECRDQSYSGGMTQAGCQAAGGVYSGDGSTCPQPGCP